jgi:hypothetical protein
MKKEFEKFIIWYIPLCLLTATMTTCLFPYLIDNAVESYGDKGEFGSWLGFLVYFTSSGHKWVAAVWLWNQKKKENGRFILWALFGFFNGMWAVAFHVALTIFEEMKDKPKANTTPLERPGANQS